MVILQTLWGWPVLGAIVLLLIGFGVGVMSMSPPDFVVARACFAAAAILLATKVAFWVSGLGGKRERILAAFLILGAIGAAWVWSQSWISSKRLQVAIQRTDKFSTMIPFDTKPGAFPIPLDTNSADPLFHTYIELRSLASNGIIPDAIRRTKEQGQVTWQPDSVSMNESNAFLGRLLQYYIFKSIDDLQKTSLTVYVGRPAESKAGIEPPDAQAYSVDKISQALNDNRFYRPFVNRPNMQQEMWRVKPLILPKETTVLFREEQKEGQTITHVVEFVRPEYFKADFLIQSFAGTGMGSVPEHFVTEHPETVMQWTFTVTMRYSINRSDGTFNPENYSQWLDALFTGLSKKLSAPQ